jgi:hypothetical protein
MKKIFFVTIVLLPVMYFSAGCKKIMKLTPLHYLKTPCGRVNFKIMLPLLLNLIVCNAKKMVALSGLNMADLTLVYRNLMQNCLRLLSPTATLQKLKFRTI